MVNFKKRLGISVILAALLLSGCQTGSESSQGESSNVSAAQSGVSSSAPAESSTVSSAKPEESSSAPAEEDPPYSEPPDPFPAGREYPDDKLVPSEWLRVDSRTEFTDRIAEAMVSDTTVKDPEEAVKALLDRNMVFICFLYGSMLDIDWDSPYDHSDYKFPIYPCTSKYFSDVKTISDLAYDTYSDNSVVEGILNGHEPRLLEIDGQMYINNSNFPLRGGVSPLSARSYIEITEKSDDKCTFILHYPDLEELNAPESGYEFHYFKNDPYTAERVDGKWKLNEFVIDY
ncbi:MAG: hypothetical protein K2J80_10055 [Oscillospiraceae bacterium]|nr:hypothetical protein [Oscillospiraceae bacterium]